MKTIAFLSFLAGATLFGLLACESKTNYIVSKDAPATKKLTDLAAGAVGQAYTDNAAQPTTPETRAVAANLSIAQTILGQPSKSSAKQAAAVAAAASKGDVDALNAKLAAANKTIATLKAEEAQQKSDAYQKLKAEQEQARKVHNAFVSRCLQWVGVALTLYAVGFLFVTKFTGISSVWPLPILSVLLWTLADFVTSIYFVWLERITVGGGVVALVIYLYEEYRAQKLTSTLSSLVAAVKADISGADIGSLWSKVVAWVTAAWTWVKTKFSGLFGKSTSATAAAAAPAAPAEPAAATEA